MGSVNTQATRSTLTSVDTTLSENITATQDYISVVSIKNFSTSVVAEIESTNEVVSFTDASENQFTYSQDFADPSWGLYSASITSNTTVAPDGTTTADTITFTNTVYGSISKTQTVVTGQPYTFSIFAKAGTTNILSLEQRTGNTPVGSSLITFNLSTGSVISSGDADSVSITDEGNGWFRCSMTTNSSPDTSEIFIIGRGNSGVSNATLFIWGAQLDNNTSLTTYLATTSSALARLTGVTRGVNGTTAQAATSGDSIQQLPYALSSVDMPIRLRAISVSPDGTGAARLTLCDNNGDTLCDVDIPDGKNYTLNLPEDGIIFPNGIFVSNTDNITAYTVYTEKYSGPSLTS